MKTGKIIAKLAERYPASLAMAWDNPGIQVGRTDCTVKKAYVALDATEEAIQDCIEWGAELLITHHPLLMSGIKTITADDMLGRKVLTLAEHGITHYAIHTNYDVTEMAKLAKAAMKLKKTEILEVTGVCEDGTPCGIGFTGSFSKKMTARECCEYVKKAFQLENVRLFGDPDAVVKRAALSPGSGKSMIAPALAAGVDVLITGDIGHHDGLDAVDNRMLVIDAGHYGIEHIFIGQMQAYLEETFPELKVKAAKISPPFVVI